VDAQARPSRPCFTENLWRPPTRDEFVAATKKKRGAGKEMMNERRKWRKKTKREANTRGNKENERGQQ
jgi:hypothetical protein